MTQRLCLIIAWGCVLLLAVLPLYGIYLLLDISAFAQFARASFQLPIQWQTVQSWQLYSLWAVSAFSLLLALAALFYLHRVFLDFAKGGLFNTENSRSFRTFSLLVFAQAFVAPIQHSAASVLLSLNHPAGEKLLSVSLGSDTLKTMALGVILWVVSEILVAGSQLEKENREFV